MSTEPSLRVRTLAHTLRELRQKAGLTQEEVAARLNFNNRKISRLETFQVPSHHELLAMLDLYGIPVNEWDPFVALREEAKSPGWWRKFGLDDRGYVPLEAQATRVRSYQLAAVHGLVQTADYTRAMGQSTVTVLVNQRRQQRLTEDPPLHLHLITDHGTLTRPQPHMAAQLRHIAALADLDNVTIQVIPPGPQPPIALIGSFTVLNLPLPHAPEIACVEHIAGATRLHRSAEVGACTAAFDTLAAAALPHDESVALIGDLAAGL